MENTAIAFHRNAKMVHGQLKKLKADIATANPIMKATHEYRIKQIHCDALSHRLCDILAEFNAQQEQYRDKCKTHAKRLLDISDISGSSLASLI